MQRHSVSISYEYHKNNNVINDKIIVTTRTILRFILPISDELLSIVLTPQHIAERPCKPTNASRALMMTSHGIFSIAAKDDQHNDNDDLCVSGDGVFALSTDIGWLLACLLTSACLAVCFNYHYTTSNMLYTGVVLMVMWV